MNGTNHEKKDAQIELQNAKTITTIDTKLSHASEDVNFVRAKMDFGNNEHMQAFPKQIGDWSASDYNTTGIGQSLSADMMLMRAYSHPELYQPVLFLIMLKESLIKGTCLANHKITQIFTRKQKINYGHRLTLVGSAHDV